MLKKFLIKLFPFWCPYCPKRYAREHRFHKHYLVCEGRLAHEERLRSIAPKNRKQKRIMAKKAGQIKDWKKLNAP